MMDLREPVRSSGQGEETKIRARLERAIEDAMKLVGDESLSTLQLESQPRVVRSTVRKFRVAPQESSDREAVLYLAALANSGRVRKALDDLYDLVHGLVKKDDFQRCDRLFVDVPADRLGVQLAVGLLTVTMRFKTQLPHRAEFVKVAKESLRKSEPEKAERLFANLE